MRFILLIVFTLILASQSLVASELVKYKVSRYFTEHGLNQNTIFSMLTDSDGFLWVGSFEGLNRFDGVSFKDYSFVHSRSDTDSLKSVTYLFEDSRGNIWIGTRNDGVFILDKSSHEIRAVFASVDSHHPITGDGVNAITEDEDGNIWIGTDNGLLHYQIALAKAVVYQFDSQKMDGLQSNIINHLLIDSAKRLWVATDDGLHRYMPIKDSFEHYIISKDILHQIGHDRIPYIFEDKNNRFWVSGGSGRLYQFDPASGESVLYNTRAINHEIVSINQDLEGNLWLGYGGGGALQINTRTGNSVRVQHNIANYEGLSSNTVISMEVDAHGLIWIGTGNGLNKVNPNLLQFGHVSYSPIVDASLKLSSIRSLTIDQLGRLWVGSLDDGINIQAQANGSNLQPLSGFKSFEEFIQNKGEEKLRNVSDIIAVGQKYVWIATGMGVRRFNVFTGQMKAFIEQDLFVTHPDQHKAKVLFNFDYQHLWVGTERGLKRLNKVTGEYDETKLLNYIPQRTKLPHDISANVSTSGKLKSPPPKLVDLSVINVRDIVRLGDWMYLGTDGDGLVAYHLNTGEIKQFTQSTNNGTELSSDVVISLLADKNDKLWIGTYTGLHQFDPVTESFTLYNTENGLINNTIYAMLEDNAGFLWFSSNKGLTRFDPVRAISTDYSVDDGVQSNEFNRRSAYKSISGELFFGGVNGFNRFHPDRLAFVKQSSKVMFTGIEINNQDYAALNPHQRNVNELTAIELSYEQRLFSVDFALLDFVNPAKHRFEYQLENFDNQWLKIDDDFRRVSYTNLPAGDYVLKIRGQNHSDVPSSNIKRIAISIAPEPWATWWAYVIYATTVLSLFLLIYRYEHQKVLQARRVNREYQKVDKLKDEFLANTSHELRTPLNGIIGLTESMLGGAHGQLSNELKEELSIVVQSGKRLANLVNDILDFSKLRNSSLDLSLQAINLHAAAQVVVVMLRSTISDKAISLVNDIDVNLVCVKADEKRLQQILFNLVGNALKYTEKGTVRIVATHFKEQVTLKVIDSGLGISEEDLTRIFTPFEQLDGGNQRAQGGTGIGLSLTKQLVEMHGGRLQVKSKLGEGSEFYFSLAVATTGDYAVNNDCLHHFNHGDSEETEQAIAQIKRSTHSEFAPIRERLLPKNKTSNEEQFKLLLVDDDAINLRVLHNYLCVEKYELKQALNGEQALKLIGEESFDLVLLDIMMPKVSGFEVCAQLRERFDVNDLPVIFITAKNQLADFVHSFSVGANDYLTKPVIKQELLARVKTHLRLLDINRNLEDKVIERTKLLNSANQNMQVLSEISQQISAILDLDILLQHVHELITPLFSNDSFLIALYNDEKKVLDFGYYCEQGKRIENIYVSIDDKDRPAVQCFESGQPVIVDDYQAEINSCNMASLEPIWGYLSQSFLYYPLIVSGKVIGVMSTQSMQSNAYSVNQQQMFQTLASSVAVAIDNARAYNQIDEQNKEIIEAQQQLVQAEKMASLGTLSAGMAHEINNPTNFIYVSSQNLSADLTAFEDFILGLAADDADEEVIDGLRRKFAPLHQHAVTILEGAIRIKDIVHDLKLFTQLDANERKVVTLSENLRTIVNLIRNQYEDVVNFEFNCQSDAKLLCFPAQLNQVFMNIIINACEAIESKIKEKKAQNQAWRGTVSIECVNEGDQVKVSIGDNGIGMSQDIADKIFEPFFTTKSVGDGAGLGLSIAYGIVNKHQGVIEVTTSKQHGTRMVVSLNNNLNSDSASDVQTLNVKTQSYA